MDRMPMRAPSAVRRVEQYRRSVKKEEESTWGVESRKSATETLMFDTSLASSHAGACIETPETPSPCGPSGRRPCLAGRRVEDACLSKILPSSPSLLYRARHHHSVICAGHG